MCLLPTLAKLLTVQVLSMNKHTFKTLKLPSIHAINKVLVLRAIICFLALWSFIWSAQLFIAGNAYYSVKNSISVWQRTPEKASKEKIEQALGKIDNALRYFPENALYHQMKGQLHEWMAFSQVKFTQTTGPQRPADANLRQAAFSYQKSLQLRPTWSGSWIGLASVKWKQGEVDETFYRYLEQAVSAGPQDAIVHKFFAEFGLEMFTARSIHYVTIQKKLKHHLDLGLQNPLSRDFVVEAIEKNQASDVVCRWLRASSYPVRKRIPNCISYK